jgi:hypothetical protein
MEGTDFNNEAAKLTETEENRAQVVAPRFARVMSRESENHKQRRHLTCL